MRNHIATVINPLRRSIGRHKVIAHRHSSGLQQGLFTLMPVKAAATTRPPGPHTKHHAYLFVIALLALTFGVLVYVTVRAPDTTGFLPAAWHITLPWPQAILAVAGSLPTFFHTVGFCLILMMLADSTYRTSILVCTGVFIVEAIFEFGQHPLSGIWLRDHLPPWLNLTWLPEHTGSALLAGVFDPFDLIAAAAGALLALMSVVMPKPGRSHGHV